MDVEQVEKAYGNLLRDFTLYVTEKFLARELGDEERAYVRSEATARWNRAQDDIGEIYGEAVKEVAKSLLWKRAAFPKYPPRVVAA